MKRTISFILSVFMLISCIPFIAFADEATVVSGNFIVPSEGADTLKVGDIIVNSGNDIEFEVIIDVYDSSSAYSIILLNNKRIASLSEGKNVIKINTADLKDGDNEIKLMLGIGSKTYAITDVYGTYNIDDITVNSVSFSGTSFDKPSKTKLYMPKENSSGVTVKYEDYKESIAVGDGWNADTGLGGNTPDVPVAVGFIFEKPDLNEFFIFDTTKVSDGEYTAELLKNGNVVKNNKYVVDNTAPEIVFSFENGAKVSRLDKITYKINDITKVTSNFFIDGKPVKSVLAKDLSLGTHNAFVVSTDEAGNVSRSMVTFEIVDKNYSINVDDKNLTMSVLGDADVYSVDLLKEIRMYENRYGEYDQDYLRSNDEVLVSFNKKSEIITTASGESVPYQSFVVNTKGVKEDNVLVSYTGTTGNGSPILLKAWNYSDECWDVIGKTASGVPITVSASLEKYSYKNKMRVNAVPDIVFNGSNTIFWNSDTQYYTRYEDLNEVYYKVNEYAVDLYKDGDIGYCILTGDLVDRIYEGDEIARNEYEVASKAQAILESANVPNGVVSGNHDINHNLADYSYYCEYFGKDRYENFDWYGGELNNNMHHYDLVSIGAYDFLFLYIGTYKETEPDTIAWANAVCKAYPGRNVIICTHEYILPSGEYSGDRAEVIWDEIVVPNKNVIMILCGHNPGVCDQKRRVGDTDRYVLEILADYQYAELGKGPQNIINGITCDGEGFVKLLTFNEAGQVVVNTYSPVAEEYGVESDNYYPSYLENYVQEVEFILSARSICTTQFNVAHSSKFIGCIGEDDISLEKYEAFYAEIKRGEKVINSEIFVLEEYKSNCIPGKAKEYNSEPEKVTADVYPHVGENLHYNEENKVPDSDLVNVHVDLLPDKAAKLGHSSGNKIFTKTDSESGGVSLTMSSGGDSWTSTVYKLNNGRGYNVNFDEYDRIYFGVTADRYTKWNISTNLAGGNIDFARNKAIATQFGYFSYVPYGLPSDITGTWQGYIDLKELGISGQRFISEVYLTTATADKSVTFDYLFLGKSNGQDVSFVTDENTISTYEGLVGNTIELPASPYKEGFVFDGWYTAKEGGEKVENVKVSEEATILYARFVENESTKREIETSNKEVNLEQVSIVKIVFVALSLLFMLAVALILVFKIKKSNKKKG